MIKLGKHIIQLRVLLKTRRSLTNIGLITASIIDDCNRLLQEHGQQEDITPLLGDIHSRAKTMGEDSDVNGKR